MVLHKALYIILSSIFICISSIHAKGQEFAEQKLDIITNYSGQNFISKNIKHSHFDEFFEDYQGRIWGCSVSGEITLWDGIDFVEISKLPGRTFGLYKYDEKNMLIGTDGGIVLFNTETYESVPINAENKKVRGLRESNNYIFAICEDCILRSSKDSLSFVNVLKLNTSRIIDSAKMGDGNILILSHYHGIFKYDIKTNQLENLDLKGIDQTKEVNLKMDMHKDSIWVGTDKNAYCAPLKKGAQLTPIKEFEGITVKCINHASDGSLLVGTDNGFFINKNGKWAQYRNYKNSMLSLLNDCVWGFFEDSRNNYWVGVEAGVSLYSAFHEYISVDWSFGNSIQGNRISCTLRDSKNRIWVGGINGLSMFDSQSDKTIIFDKNGKHSCLDSRIWKVVEDKSGNIWVCTDESIGIYDEKCETFIPKMVVDTETGKTSKWAYDLIDSNDGFLWIATGSAGFLRVAKNLLMGNEEIISADLAINAGNSKYKVGSDVGFRLYLSDMVIWGVLPDGIYNLSEMITKESANRVNQPDHAIKGSTHITCDHLTNIWAATGNFLSCADVKTREIKSYDINQIGIPGNLLGFAKSGTQLLVLSSKCLALFDPQIENVIPLLEQEKSSYRTIYFDEKDNLIYLGGADHFLVLDQTKLIDNLKNYERPSYISAYKLNDNNLTVSFSNNRIEEQTPPYSGYYYRLKGYDENWIPVNRGLSVDYKMLPPDDYLLQLGKRFGLNDQMELVDEISIVVPYPWYNSIWFYALLIFLAILAASGYIRQYSLGLQLKLAKADKELLLSQYASTKAATIDAVTGNTEELSKMSATKLAMIEKANKRWLDELQKQVENHLTDTDFNVSALAEISGMNEKTLYRKIKTLTGKTTIEYIKTLRMERAAALLQSEDLAINEVMYMAGFVSPSYFSRCFEETYHMKPSEYRQKHQKTTNSQESTIE